MPLAVRDREGRFIPGLRPEQFRLFEDGAEQEIAFFETADKPFTVALLLDLSDSARFKREDIRAAARAFTRELRADDRLAVVAFDKNVAVLTGPTADRAVIKERDSIADCGLRIEEQNGLERQRTRTSGPQLPKSAIRNPQSAIGRIRNELAGISPDGRAVKCFGRKPRPRPATQPEECRKP